MKTIKGILDSLSFIVLILLIVYHFIKIDALIYVALALFAIYIIYCLMAWKEHKWQIISMAVLTVIIALLFLLG